MARFLVVTARERYRRLFDTVAERYDQVRPGYPAAMYDDLAELAGIGPGCRVLEIGCGTGQATVPLAERGCQLVIVELGAAMAERARANLARFGDQTRIEVADFDTWTTTEAPFDLVFAATAFHWLDPATRYDRTADLLRESGALVTVSTSHVAGGTEQFFVDVQSCYRRYLPDTPPDHRLPTEAQVGPDRDLGRTGRYAEPAFRRYTWTAAYTSTQFVNLLRTYSPTLALSPLVREAFLGCVGSLIDGRFGGTITKRYLTELRVARKAR